MTVSRALAGHPNVSAKTRALILAHAAAVGYVKSSAASAMRGAPTAIVGLVMPNVVNEFYARFANTLGMLCADRDLDVVIHLTNDEPEREHNALQRLSALQASAIIMVPVTQTEIHKSDLIENVRVIDLIRTRQHRAPVDTLLIDDASSIAAAVRHIVSLGIQNIGYIGSAETMSSGNQRLSAFRAALAANGVAEQPHLIRTGSPGFEMGRTSAASLVEGRNPPRALICGGFEISRGALDACLARGMEFPKELAFVGYGDPSAFQWIAGGITTIAISPDEIAASAVEMLTSTNEPGHIRNSTTPTCFVVRHSA